MDEVKRLARRLLSNTLQLPEFSRAELEGATMRLARAHSCLARQLSESLAQLRMSRDDLQKNQRALVRTLSEKRQPQSRPRVSVQRPRSPDDDDDDDEESITGSLEHVISQVRADVGWRQHVAFLAMTSLFSSCVFHLNCLV